MWKSAWERSSGSGWKGKSLDHLLGDVAYKIEKRYVIDYLHKEKEGGDRRGKNNTTFPYMLDVRRVTFSLQIDFLLYETLWSCPFQLEPTLHIKVHTYILCVCAYYYMCVHAWRPLSISPVPTIYIHITNPYWYLVLHMSAHNVHMYVVILISASCWCLYICFL